MIYELATDWVNALRNGNFQQGKNFLNRDNEFCCLGVLCEVAGIEKKESLDNLGFTYYGNDTYLSKKIQGIVGFKDDEGKIRFSSYDVEYMKKNFNIIINENFYSLAYLNDAGVPFDHIADIIEKYWMEL